MADVQLARRNDDKLNRLVAEAGRHGSLTSVSRTGRGRSGK
jgi:hypothetical protein